MPRANRKPKAGKRGYRKRLTQPRKGCKPYKRQDGGKDQFVSGAIANVSLENAHAKHQTRFCSGSAHLDEPSQLPQLSESVCDDTDDEERQEDFLGFQDTPSVKGLRVLSLFDGIGSAKVALDQLAVPVAHYFSSEVDEAAISVLKRHYYKHITMLGCVRTIREEKLQSLGKVHLLMGGSPCSDLSLCNPARRGLHGKDSSGLLFFDYHRVLCHLREAAAEGGYDFWWLYENTAAMEKQCVNEISSYLGCEPVILCSSMDVAMKRRRCYWSNLPGLLQTQVPPVITPSLQDFLLPYRTAKIDMLPTLTGNGHSQLSGVNKQAPVVEDGVHTKLLIIEEERLFGFPMSYTDVNLSITARMKLLGKAWCIPTIVRILEPLAKIVKEGDWRE